MNANAWQRNRSAPAAKAPAAPSRSGWASFLYPEESWVPMVLLALLALSTVWAVEGAKWVPDMPSLSLLSVAALFVGYFFSRFRVPGVLLHPPAVIIGLLLTLHQTVEAAKGATFNERLADAVIRLNSFALVVKDGGINVDTLPFITQVLAFTFLVGYLSAWFFYRQHNAWLAMLPPGIALFVNLTYLPNGFTFNFVLFVITAMMLAIYANTVQQQLRWRRDNVPRKELAELAIGGPLLAFSGVLLALTFVLPILGQSLSVMVAWEQATGPWRSMEREFDRLFASVSSGKVAPLHSFGRAMPFRGAVKFGDQLPLAGRFGLARDVIMNVKTEEPGYWRAESYDVFTGQGWITAERRSIDLPRDTVHGAIEEYKERKAVQQFFDMQIPLDLYLFRGMPVFGNTPAVGEVPTPASFTLQLNDLPGNRGLRPEMQDLARTVGTNLRNAGRLVAREEIQRMLPADLAVVRPVRSQGQGSPIDGLILRRTEPFPPDYSSLRARTAVARGMKYTITSSVSNASVETLEAAGTNYPGWVLDQYLQLPDSTTERVRQRGRAWSRDSRNPYDMAWAIESRLREIPYSTNIPAPPRDQDGVDYFMFSLNRGYADYYASAMAVMLRSLGIPARVAVGYVAGDWDQDKEHFVVREAHAHAWVEVFFPNYGWIEFNPSPNWPTVPRVFQNAGQGVGDEDFMNEPPAGSEEEGEETPGDLEPAAGGFFFSDPMDVIRPLAAGAGTLVALWLVGYLVWTWGLRGLSLPAQTYEKMCRLAGLARLRPRYAQTPYEYAQALGSVLPAVQGSVRTIAREYARTRYSPQPLTGEDALRIKLAWPALRWALLQKIVKFWERRRNR